MNPEPRSSSRTPLLVAGGCVIVALCLALVGVGGVFGWRWYQQRTATGATEPAVEYIMDASPRMAQPAEGDSRTRLAVAQGVLAEIVRPADPTVTAGLRVFGSGAIPEGCKDTSLVVPLGQANQSRISEQLVSLQSGQIADAAMGEAMVAAIRDLSAAAGPHTLVVVTGGQDSCNAEASQLIASEAQRAGIDLKLFVVGYGVPAAEEQAIKGMIEATGTAIYIGAKDEGELRATLAGIQASVDDPETVSVAEVIATAKAGGADTGGPAPATAPPGEKNTPVGGATEAPTAEATQALGAGGLPDVSGYQAQSACDHPYFPLREGATWSYASDFGSYTWTVSGVTGDMDSATATMNMGYEGGSFTMGWNCSAEGIVSYDWVNFGNMAGPDAVVSFDVTSHSGTWLPPASELELGTSWNSAYTMVMSISAADVSVDTTTEVAETYTAAGVESVDVNGEEQRSVRVDGSSNQTFTSSFGGTSTSGSSTSNTTYWLAYGIGLTRFSSSAEGVSTTSTLTSYSVP